MNDVYSYLVDAVDQEDFKKLLFDNINNTVVKKINKLMFRKKNSNTY